ncbi:MAG TPA: preprotein translocase subunit SecY [Chthoniobacteraceae bacterium]|jgi:preprotein translocase subunit SecY|nr:preprotein translocase subunit SecY [Chthoniobacteraceae bacterium]
MISAFTNTFKVPELRNRVIFTLLMLVVCRIGCAITSPGVNVAVLQYWFANNASKGGNGVAALFNLFSGGALENCAVFSLGVMPYISASIMMQLLSAVIPQLNKLSKEDNGRQKIMQYTRYATIALCVFQGYLLSKSFEFPSRNPFLQGIDGAIQHLGIPLVQNPGLPFELLTVLTLTAGTMFLMWVGDQITDRGVGNGMSMIITVGIVARLPAALIQAWKTFVPSGPNAGQTVNPMVLVLMIAFLIIVIAAVIAVTEAQRKVPVQYAKRVVGRKVYGGGTQYMPLKVLYPGVMPIIFGQALLLFPASIAQMIRASWAQVVAAAVSPNGSAYYVIYGLMIFFFSYFWVATTFQPGQIADDLKKYGGYVPGVRPGKPTADFLDFAMTRLTFAGAIFLTVIGILPQLLSRQLGVPYLTASFFGGTSLLIIVGVMLDTMRQVETHLIQRHYDGFLRKGRLRGGFERTPQGRGEAVQQGVLIWACVAAAVLLVIGLAVFLVFHAR